MTYIYPYPFDPTPMPPWQIEPTPNPWMPGVAVPPAITITSWPVVGPARPAPGERCFIVEHVRDSVYTIRVGEVYSVTIEADGEFVVNWFEDGADRGGSYEVYPQADAFVHFADAQAEAERRAKNANQT